MSKKNVVEEVEVKDTEAEELAQLEKELAELEASENTKEEEVVEDIQNDEVIEENKEVEAEEEVVVTEAEVKEEVAVEEVKETVVEEPATVERNKKTPDGAVYPDNLPPSLKEAFANLDPSARMTALTVLRYIDRMNGKQEISLTDGAKQQEALYRALALLINSTPDKFAANAEFLFPLVALNLDGVFHERKRLRFTQYISLSENDSKALPCLFTLVCMIADPKTRKLIRDKHSNNIQESLQKAVGDRGLNQRGQANIFKLLGL